MKSHFNLQRIDFVRAYVDKHIDKDTLSTHEVVMELCEETAKLWVENQSLREQLFNIEQEQDPEKRWETILAAKLDRAIRENLNKDYLEINNSTNGEVYTITIQRKHGQTPEYLRRQSDIRRLKAEKKNEHLLNDNQQMQKKLHQLDEELRILKAIKNGDWDDIKTRQDIEVAIDIVNHFIRQHNQHAYKKQLAKLTNSMRESMHEAWARASEASWKVTEIKKELEALKLELHRKNVEKSKFAKYRKHKSSQLGLCRK